jgi:hypothetical protein
LLGVTDGGKDPTYHDYQISDLLLIDASDYTRALLDFSPNTTIGKPYGDMKTETVMRTFMNTLGIGPKAVNKY